MKKILCLLIAMGMVCVFAVDLSAQVFNVGQSSEWEATGFNNGRRVVRDCTMPFMGYFHYVWHSQIDPNMPPMAANCDIYYACTDHFGNIVIPPTNMTWQLEFFDNRYPSIAIENDGIDQVGDWRRFNTIHIVWQVKKEENVPYEVFHAKIAVAQPPTPPAFLTNIKNLSQTPETDSLVPAIAINHYGASPVFNQNIHVVWQEEDVFPGTLASDIYYTRSLDSGLTFQGPISGGLWDNITNTPENSQMPSISCCLDTFYGFPIFFDGWDSDYNNYEVQISYNEDIGQNGINVFYLMSPNNGNGWNPPINVTQLTGGDEETRDGYSNIAVDMMALPPLSPYLIPTPSGVHIVFMRDVQRNEPTMAYAPGIDPTLIVSFPGPDPGMYNALNNQIIYWSNVNPQPLNLFNDNDKEFPTVALDRRQNVTVNWQEYFPMGPDMGDYEIMRIYNNNAVPPTRPLPPPMYGMWAGLTNDSQDMENDDLFPNLAHKKVATYLLLNWPPIPGYTEAWTKVTGNGPAAAIAAMAKNIWSSNNVQRDPAVN